MLYDNLRCDDKVVDCIDTQALVIIACLVLDNMPSMIMGLYCLFMHSKMCYNQHISLWKSAAVDV